MSVAIAADSTASHIPREAAEGAPLVAVHAVMEVAEVREREAAGVDPAANPALDGVEPAPAVDHVDDSGPQPALDISGSGDPAVVFVPSTAPLSSALPLTPSECLSSHAHLLSEYEKGEILQATHIWFLGASQRGKLAGTDPQLFLNHGFDDERGDYRIYKHDHIGYRFEVPLRPPRAPVIPRALPLASLLLRARLHVPPTG